MFSTNLKEMDANEMDLDLDNVFVFADGWWGQEMYVFVVICDGKLRVFSDLMVDFHCQSCGGL